MAFGFDEAWLAHYQKGRPTRQDALYGAESVLAASRPTQNKYGAQKAVLDGYTFDSKKEMRRYETLKLWQQVGAIRDLELQPRYELIASNGEIVGHFTPDFRYWSLEFGRLVVEDVKSTATKTTAYRLRKRLFTACHGIALSEV